MEISRWDALGFLYTREMKWGGNWRKEYGDAGNTQRSEER